MKSPKTLGPEQRLKNLRQRIDRVDDSIVSSLFERMLLTQAIGIHKKSLGWPLVQKERWRQLMLERKASARARGLSTVMVEKLWSEIGKESVRGQKKVGNWVVDLEQFPRSKSMEIRRLLIESYSGGRRRKSARARIQSRIQSKDIRVMAEALVHWKKGKSTLWLGESALSLRCLALRVAREKGVWLLQGAPSLWARPHEELLSVLRQLGCEAHMDSDGLRIVSKDGWKVSKKRVIRVRSDRSSQVASALLLNAWNLIEPMRFEIPKARRVSESYFQMSVRMANEAGMSLSREKNVWTVPKGINPSLRRNHREVLNAEPDHSALVWVGLWGAFFGTAVIRGMDQKTWKESLQGDHVWVEWLEQMGVCVEWSGRSAQSRLRVSTPGSWGCFRGQILRVADQPDLVPAFVTLALAADRPTTFWGVQHLRFKESDRLAAIQDVIRQLGGVTRIKESKNEGLGLQVYPLSPQALASHLTPEVTLPHVAEMDHRMVMMASVLKVLGFPIRIRFPQAVGKSFPEYWNYWMGQKT